jgi:ABC-type transport system involved in cytochrome c biogenesis ATPase subunit/GNAT superfamily N-acetyltransferase
LRRREFFRIRKYCRVYDRRSGRFTINVAYETAAPKPTERVVTVAEAFGLGLDKWDKFVIYDNVELKIGASDIVYLTGDSGSGKSVLLKAILKDLGDEAADISAVSFEPSRPLIETVGETVEEGLELLSRVGLSDAFLFLRTYDQLSDGQRYRYRLAKLLESKKQWWIMDEFAATLDRDTAKIVTYNLQKIARQEGRAVVAATTHTDLFEDLAPSVHIHKRFGREISVNYYPNTPAKQCSLVREMTVAEGTMQDWKQLSCFHYRGHKIAAPRKTFCLKRGDELCGVIVYCYPPPSAFGRREVLPALSMRELNEKVSIISRVVVHPKYRTIGLGAKLVRETLPLAGTNYVEMVAVMAKYNPFAEKGGLTKTVEQPPPKEALKIAGTLEKLGFNIQLLGSENYNLKKLQSLKPDDVEIIREAFIKYSCPRFMKSFGSPQPFGEKQEYTSKILNASLETMAHLIKICGMLLQTKVYLFWKKYDQ